MKKQAIIILLIVYSMVSLAQEKRNENRTEKQLDYAKELISLNDYHNAYLSLMEIYSEDSTNLELNYYLGLTSFYANRNKEKALPYLQKGVLFNENAFYFMGIIYHQQEHFDLALEAYNNYKRAVYIQTLIPLDKVNKQIEKINTAKELLKHKKSIQIANLGKEINSPFPDYAPILFANGNRLFFTSRRKGSFPEYKDPNNEYFEDIYFSEKVNGIWEKPVNVGNPINTKTHDASVAISEKDSAFYIYRTNPNLISGDIFISVQHDGKWQNPKLFESSINSKKGTESSISIHPNGNKIFFSSNREGGYGGKDLYFVQKLPNGKWSLPTNLGGIINTPEDEDAPFISPDGQVLYFSSKGHKNMGGYDLFKSRLKTNKQWSEPENMGAPINSVRDDIFISTLNNKDYFFSSNRSGGFGFADIYHTIIPPKKNDYIVIKGRIIDNTTQLSTKAMITVFNTVDNRLEGAYRSNYMSGRFIMILKPDEQYKMFIESDGYYSQTLLIDLTKSLTLEDVLKTIRLNPKERSNHE